MPFRLRRDARRWFVDVENAFNLDFDMYYLCLMAGLGCKQKADVATEETTELVDYFPGVYREKGRVIVALFLSRALRSMGIKMTERGPLHAEIAKFVDPLSPSHLSDAGMKAINRYSYGGFEVLTDWFEDRPRAIETFLPLYKRQLDAALADATA